MTDDTEFTLDVGTDALESLMDADEPVETALTIGSDLPDGALSLAGGSVLLLWAGRSLARGQLRSIPNAIVGAGLLRYGIRKRRASEPASDATTTDAGEIEFTNDESDASEGARSKPDLNAEHGDSRRETDGEAVEIDISESAVADEASEAAGPSPEQAHPSQIDDVEPEEDPADLTVEPGDETDETAGPQGQEADTDDDETDHSDDDDR